KTGFSHFRLRRPGEGPKCGSAPGPLQFALRARKLSFIQMEAVCHPDAHKPPSTERFAASSSRWMGWGSYFAAKALIASAVKRWGPIGTVSPVAKYSSRVMRQHPGPGT